MYWIRRVEVDGNNIYYDVFVGNTVAAMNMSNKKGVKYKVLLEDVKRGTDEVGCFPPIIKKAFDDLADAAWHYEHIDTRELLRARGVEVDKLLYTRATKKIKRGCDNMKK